MKETIRTILLEWQDRELPGVIRRDTQLDGYLPETGDGACKCVKDLFMVF
ncbi:MAG: hypothetical protein PVH61_35580 [Candidatus Aminicenantes bacterium]|jgi:hypothetical protein